jgi:hypothetical protein
MYNTSAIRVDGNDDYVRGHWWDRQWSGYGMVITMTMNISVMVVNNEVWVVEYGRWNEVKMNDTEWMVLLSYANEDD